jgi:ACS family hexuronate transporter-like MFS transporter
MYSTVDLSPVRHPSWRWWVCGLLLMATMINYMDRLVLNQTATRLMEAREQGGLDFDEEGYGLLEGLFGFAFAVGALSMGFVADRFGPRVVYPTLVLLWSVAGFLTGFVRSFEELLVCRIALGFFEAGNWSCALKTTQAVLRPQDRAMGNGILQSGAAVGAVLTPMLVLGFMFWNVYDGWRPAFWVVGGLGLFWVAAWLLVVREGDLERFSSAIGTDRTADEPQQGQFVRAPSGLSALLRIARDPRFWVLAFVVIAINLTWHFFRAWGPLFLEKKHGFSRYFIQWFGSAYYLATDVGSLAAGYLALRLARGGLPIHKSRLIVFGSCAVLTLLSIPVALLPAGAAEQAYGPLLLVLLLVLGFAALGLFPNYYSFSQELTTRHQGKVSGILGCGCWLAMFVMQISVGTYIKKTQSYTIAVALGGLPPLAALLVLLLFWRSSPAQAQVEPTPLPDAKGADLANAITASAPAPADERVLAGVEAVKSAEG